MNGPGRPTLYRDDYVETAGNYCRLGATNDELAGFFGVAPRTLDNWLRMHPAFAGAVRDGRAFADAKVARSLFERALGYDYTTARVFLDRGRPVRVAVPTHLPPSIAACVFWLRNRRREDWVERARS